MTVSFHPAAEQEYSEAIDYYEERDIGRVNRHRARGVAR